MYKPGQIVTINSKKYRIKKSKFEIGCIKCTYGEKNIPACKWCIDKLRFGYFLDPIKNPLMSR